MPSYVRVIRPAQMGQLQGQYAKRIRDGQKKLLSQFGDDWSRKLEAESARLIGRQSVYGDGWVSRATDTIVRIWNKAAHAIFVERGRKPGKQPPMEALREWCATYLGDPRLAFVVARAIGRRGVFGRPNMEAIHTQFRMRTDFRDRVEAFCDLCLRKAGGF